MLFLQIINFHLQAIAKDEFDSLPPSERSRKFENQLVFERVFDKQSSLKRKERLKKIVAKVTGSYLITSGDTNCGVPVITRVSKWKRLG